MATYDLGMPFGAQAAKSSPTVGCFDLRLKSLHNCMLGAYRKFCNQEGLELKQEARFISSWMTLKRKC